MIKRNLATPAAADIIPVKPKRPATRAIIKNVKIHASIFVPPIRV